jgi:hypothetical protein
MLQLHQMTKVIWGLRVEYEQSNLAKRCPLLRVPATQQKSACQTSPVHHPKDKPPAPCRTSCVEGPTRTNTVVDHPTTFDPPNTCKGLWLASLRSHHLPPHHRSRPLGRPWARSGVLLWASWWPCLPRWSPTRWGSKEWPPVPLWRWHA